MFSIQEDLRKAVARSGVRRDLLIGLLGFALGAGATFLVWRQHAGTDMGTGVDARQAAQALRLDRGDRNSRISRSESTGTHKIEQTTSTAGQAKSQLNAPAAAARPTNAGLNAALPGALSTVPSTPAATPPVGQQTASAAAGTAAAVTPGAPLEISVDNLFDGTGYNGAWHQRTRASAETQVTYRLERRGERVVITPSSALHMAAQGAQALPSAPSVAEALQWQLPRLTLRVENKSAHPLAVATLELDVRRSDSNSGALLFVPSQANGALELENVGWGKVVQPELKLGFASAQQFDSVQPARAMTMQTLKLDDFDERLRVDLRARVPAELRAAGATVYGTLSYATESGEKHALPFRTLVSFGRAGAPRRWRPLFFHHVLLKAGQLGITTLPLATRVAPGKVFESKLRIASDRSTRQEVVLTLKGTDGATIASQLLDLEIFVPRFDAPGIVRRPSSLRVAGD